MKLPRWLTSRFVVGLHELDVQFARQHFDGVLNVQIHYRGGVARVGKVLGQAPFLMDMALSSTSS